MAGVGGRALVVRLGAPAALLAAATAAVLLVRAGLRHEESRRVGSATPAAALISHPASGPAKQARKRFYVIRAGDTLDAVATRIGTSVDHLLELNPDVRPTSLRIGQKIRTA